MTKSATAALGFGRAADDMTPKQLAVIERARHSPTRIVEIERTRRGTAYRNVMKRCSAKAALERELERLVGTWGRIEWQRRASHEPPWTRLSEFRSSEYSHNHVLQHGQRRKR